MRFELAPFNLSASYAEGIVSLDDVKAHLGVLHSDQDVLIGFYRDAAVDMVEQYCAVRLAPCAGLEWRGEYLPREIELGVHPVTGVTEVKWLDSEGSNVDGDATAWRVLRRDRITLKPGATAPASVAAGATITFDAGYTDANRPAALVQAVKLFTGHLFNNREAVVMGTAAGEIPLGFRQLCSAYRMPVI